MELPKVVPKSARSYLIADGKTLQIISIPKEVREFFNWNVGDIINIFIGNGVLVLKKDRNNE